MPRYLSAICGLLLLAACQKSSPVEAPPLTFTQYQPIHMAVSSIEVIEEYKPPMTPPNVEHLIPYSPTEAMQIWVRDRLRASGNDKTLQIIVKDGSVVRTSLPKKGGIQGFFTNDQEASYEAKLAIEMRIYGTGTLSEASIEVTANRSMTVPEGASVRARDAIFRQMIADLMEITNAQIEKNLYMYMSNYVSYSQNP